LFCTYMKNKTVRIDIWGAFWSIVWMLLLILFVLRIFVFQQVSVFGDSMQLNYFEGEQLLINRRVPELKRGHVVAVYENRDVARNANFFTPYQAKLFLKRIIALPGEEVEIIGPNVIIYNDQNPDGVLLNEEYISPKIRRQMELLDQYYPRTEVPEGEFYVLGDNRANSKDSRVTGPFPDYSVFGAETLRFWPSSTARFFELPEYLSLCTDYAQRDLVLYRAEYQNGLSR